MHVEALAELAEGTDGGDFDVPQPLMIISVKTLPLLLFILNHQILLTLFSVTVLVCQI